MSITFLKILYNNIIYKRNSLDLGKGMPSHLYVLLTMHFTPLGHSPQVLQLTRMVTAGVTVVVTVLQCTLTMNL